MAGRGYGVEIDEVVATEVYLEDRIVGAWWESGCE